MQQNIKGKVEAIVYGLVPSLGGADIRLKDIDQGVVTLEYRRPLSNPSACHVDRTRVTREIIIELLQDELRRVLPDFNEIIIIGEE